MANKPRIARTAISALVILWEDGFFVRGESSKRSRRISPNASIILRMRLWGWR